VIAAEIWLGTSRDIDCSIQCAASVVDRRRGPFLSSECERLGRVGRGYIEGRMKRMLPKAPVEDLSRSSLHRARCARLAIAHLLESSRTRRNGPRSAATYLTWPSERGTERRSDDEEI